MVKQHSGAKRQCLRRTQTGDTNTPGASAEEAETTAASAEEAEMLEEELREPEQLPETGDAAHDRGTGPGAKSRSLRPRDKLKQPSKFKC